MFKKTKLLLFAVLLLVACSSNDEDMTPKSTTSTKNDVQLEVDVPTLSEEEATKIADEVLDNLLYAIYPDKVGQYEMYEEVQYDDSEWQEIYTLQEKMVREYATSNFFHSNIVIDFSQCDDNCYSELPRLRDYLWKPTIKIKSDNEFQLIGLSSSRFVEDYSSYEEIVDFVLEDGHWKVNALTFNEKDMNITEDEIERYLAMEDFDDVTVTETVEAYKLADRTEKVYLFTNNYNGHQYILLARTGYYINESFSYDELNNEDLSYDDDESELSFGSQDDYTREFLFYDWSDYATNVNTNDPTVKIFYDELLQIDKDRNAAYTAKDEAKLEALVEQVTTLSQNAYNYYTTKWDESTQLSYESGSRDWFQHFMYYFDEMLPTDTPQLDRLNDEVIIRYNDVYGLLATAESSADE